jgi:hypothetical protein
MLRTALSTGPVLTPASLLAWYARRRRATAGADLELIDRSIRRLARDAALRPRSAGYRTSPSVAGNGAER